MFYEVVRSLDPSSDISFSGQHVKVRLNADISASELINDLSSNGGGNYVVDMAEMEKTGVNDFPVRRDTGSPDHDDAVYTAEKQAWILAHPDAYKAMNELETLKNE